MALAQSTGQCAECRRVLRLHARGRCAACYRKAREAGLPLAIRVPLPPCRRCNVPVAKRSYIYCADCRAVVLAAYRAGQPVPPLGAAPVERVAPPAPRPATERRKHRQDYATAAVWQADVEGVLRGLQDAPVVAIVGPDTYAEAIRVVVTAGWEE